MWTVAAVMWAGPVYRAMCQEGQKLVLEAHRSAAAFGRCALKARNSHLRHIGAQRCGQAIRSDGVTTLNRT